MSTSTHIRTPCPNCQARLRVNPEYVGRVVTCKLCGHSFPCARADDPAPVSPIPEPEPGGGGPAAAPPPNGKTPTTVEDAAQKVLTRLLARNQKYVLLKQRFAQAVDRCAALDEQVRELRGGFDRDRDPSGPVVALLQELEEVRAARDGLSGHLDAARADLGRLQDRVAELERFQSAPDDETGGNGPIAEYADPGGRAQGANGCGTVARLSEALGRAEALEAEFGAARADRERALAEASRTAGAWESGWEAERRALTAQAETARQAWESERQALSAQAEAERRAWEAERHTLIDQSEAAHQALSAQAETARRAWESERQILIEQAETERQALIDQSEAARRAWDAERQVLDDQAETERRAVRADMDRLRAETERAGMEAALGRRAATEGALAERETRLSEALGRAEALEAERDAARADRERALAEASRTAEAWEAERQALTDQSEAARRAWESERQALIDQSEAAHQALSAQAETARRVWESERQALMDQAEAARRAWESERQERAARAEAETARWEERLGAARDLSERERAALQGDLERFRQEIDALRSERDALQGERATTLQLIEALNRERAEVATARDQVKGAFSAGEQVYQAKIAQLDQALRQATRDGEAARRRGDELAGQVEALRADRQQSHEVLAALRQDLQAERARAEERAAAGASPREGDPLRNERETMLRLIEELSQDRVRIAAYREQLQATSREAEKGYQAKIAQLEQTLRQAERGAAAAAPALAPERGGRAPDGGRPANGAPREDAASPPETAAPDRDDLAHRDAALSQIGSLLDSLK